MASERVSLSELQRRTGFHRVTIRRRLDEAKIKPASAKYNQKLYDVDTATKVLTSSINNGNGHERGLTEARRRKTIAETARITLALRRERADLVPLGEVRDHLFEIIKAIYTRVARRYPRENARRLRKCRTTAE